MKWSSFSEFDVPCASGKFPEGTCTRGNGKTLSSSPDDDDCDGYDDDDDKDDKMDVVIRIRYISQVSYKMPLIFSGYPSDNNGQEADKNNNAGRGSF